MRKAADRFNSQLGIHSLGFKKSRIGIQSLLFYVQQVLAQREFEQP